MTRAVTSSKPASVVTMHDSHGYAAARRRRPAPAASISPLFEYACREGNYPLALGLSGARAEERARAPR